MIVVESGGTKSTWIFSTETRQRKRVETVGLHPQELSLAKRSSIQQLVKKYQLTGQSLYFYGAGCESQTAKLKITQFLAELGLQVKEVQTDIHAACLALLGNSKGVVGILGTGAVAAQFDGERIIKQTSVLGYILGDEGSGFDIGKRLLQHYFKADLSLELREAIEDYFEGEAVLHRIHEPDGRMFIAGLSKLAHQYRYEKEVKQILDSAFSDFYITALQELTDTFTVHFVGSIAFYFKDELRNTLSEHGLSLGNVEKEAVSGVFSFLSRQNDS